MPEVTLARVGGLAYPSNLRRAYDRPPFLFVHGTLADSDSRALAVVGSRRATAPALDAAAAVASAAAAAGVTVVSGLARGVDAAAHSAALDAGGRTIAVMGTGIDEVYPPDHAPLAKAVARSGAVVSQFRPGSPGTKSSFPMRNAVISGLSAVSVLIDAEERSGSRSEAEAALRQGRAVLLWRPTLGAKEWARRWAARSGLGWAADPDGVVGAVSDAGGA